MLAAGFFVCVPPPLPPLPPLPPRQEPQAAARCVRDGMPLLRAVGARDVPASPPLSKPRVFKESSSSALRARPSAGGPVRACAGPSTSLVWNFPLDLTFRATSVFGWPKLHFSVYGLNVLGMDVIQGYGFTHIPSTPGHYSLKVHLFKPKNRSRLLSLYAWFNQQPAEFKRAEFVCQSEGREGAHPHCWAYALCPASGPCCYASCRSLLPSSRLLSWRPPCQRAHCACARAWWAGAADQRGKAPLPSTDCRPRAVQSQP